MLVPKSLSFPKVITLSIILIVAVGFGSYLVYENFLKEKVTTLEINFKTKETLFDKPLLLPEAQDFDANFFNNEMIIKLQNYGPLPVIVDNEALGRDNPFTPLFIKGVTKPTTRK